MLFLGFLIIFSLLMCGHLYLHFPKEKPRFNVMEDPAFLPPSLPPLPPVHMYQALTAHLVCTGFQGLMTFLGLQGRAETKRRKGEVS